MEQGFTFPTDKTEKRKRTSVKKQAFTEADGLQNTEQTEEPEQTTKASDIWAEDTLESGDVAAKTGNGSGSGTLMDFLNVGIFEGQ